MANVEGGVVLPFRDRPALGGLGPSSVRSPAFGGSGLAFGSGSVPGTTSQPTCWQTDERCPEAERVWHRFPDTAGSSVPPFRVGSDRKLDRGIYRKIQAKGLTYYIHIDDLSDPNLPEETAGQHVDRCLMVYNRQQLQEMIVSVGTLELYDNEVVLYGKEPVEVFDNQAVGLLIVASRLFAGPRVVE